MYRKETFLEIYAVTVREDKSLGYGQYPAETGTVGGVLEECHLRAVGQLRMCSDSCVHLPQRNPQA